MGTVIAWTSPAQPYLNKCAANMSLVVEDGQMVCDLDELEDPEFSLVGSLFPIGALISGQVRTNTIGVKLWLH